MLLTLSEHVVQLVLGHVPQYEKACLLQTCKAVRQAVLQQESRLELHVGSMGSGRSHSEARAVVRRRVPVGNLKVILQEATQQQVQHLFSVLAAEPAHAEHPCAVSALVVNGDYGDENVGSWGALLGHSFPSITFLELSFLNLDARTLQSLARCTALTCLKLTACRTDPTLTHQQLRTWLPLVTDQIIGLGDEDWAQAVKAEQWILALAPQITTFHFSGPLDAAAQSALAQCTQLVEVYLTEVNQATLEVLLGLPSLTKVTCDRWEADAGGRTCAWALLDPCLPDMAQAASLPLGVHTLHLPALHLDTADTPAASFGAAQALAEAIAGACQHVAWDGGPPTIRLDTRASPRSQLAACVEATLQGLAPLHPRLQEAQLRLRNMLPVPFDASLARALSPAGAYMQRLEMVCPTVEAGAWAALPAALPALRDCELHVGVLSEESLNALRVVCRNPPGRAAGGAPVLRSIAVNLPDLRVFYNRGDRVRMRQQLAQLQAELRASGAPLELHL